MTSQAKHKRNRNQKKQKRTTNMTRRHSREQVQRVAAEITADRGCSMQYCLKKAGVGAVCQTGVAYLGWRRAAGARVCLVLLLSGLVNTEEQKSASDSLVKHRGERKRPRIRFCILIFPPRITKVDGVWTYVCWAAAAGAWRRGTARIGGGRALVGSSHFRGELQDRRSQQAVESVKNRKRQDYYGWNNGLL